MRNGNYNSMYKNVYSGININNTCGYNNMKKKIYSKNASLKRWVLSSDLTINASANPNSNTIDR